MHLYILNLVNLMPFRSLIVFVLFVILGTNHAFSQTSEKGIIHFPGKGQQEDDVAILDVNWQFCFGKHLSASEMERIRPEDKDYLVPPLNWMAFEKKGKKTPAFGIATYYLKIVVDSNRRQAFRDYAFRIIDISTAYILYINGVPIMSTGIPATDSTGFKPGDYPKIGFVHTDKDTLNVVIHASNFINPFFSGISRSILFGQEKAIARVQLLRSSLTIFLMCIFAVLFFFELMVYTVLPKEKLHMMVCLLALFSLIRMLMDSDISIYHFFPNLDYHIGFKIWMTAFLIIPILFSLIRLSFPNEIHRRATLIVHLFFGVFAICLLFLPLPMVLKILMPVIYFSICCIFYLFWVIVKALIHKRAYAIPHFISFGIALSCVLADLVMIAKPGKVDFIAQIGMAIYLITQTSIILLRFIKAHDLWLKLTKELEVTNHNLEATVEKRTRELQRTNSMLERVNNQKNFMLATTSHDLKNSFNILINCSDYMVEDKTLTADQRVYSEMIKEAAKHGYRVLENILSWARMQMTDYQGTNVVSDIKNIFEKEVETFQNELQEKELQVRMILNNNYLFDCSEDQLYSIGRNLLSNAIKFSQPGGEIVISNKLVDHMVEILIHDNGIGMNQDMIDKLFDTTIDNKRRGTSGEFGSGLGLIIVKELVESNKGTITCLSEPGKGTDFIVRFPHKVE